MAASSMTTQAEPNGQANHPTAQSPPVTDMTGICFRDQLWLNTYPLDRNLIFDYFALSPFYDPSCNNEQLRSRSIHPLDAPHLSKMTGMEYMLTEVMEPNLFVIRKQRRDGVDKVNPTLSYYILDGSVYQAPQLGNVFASRIGRALCFVSKAFTVAASKLEKIGFVDLEDDDVPSDSRVGAEKVDMKEVKRIDHILASIQRKFSPAPPPPSFPEGFVTPSMVEDGEDDPESQQRREPQSLDPIVDQGPAKRLKI